VSACLLGQEVRHDGGHKRCAFVVEDLARVVELVPVCPEVEIGLGVPREPIRLQVPGSAGGGTTLRLVAYGSGRDLTERMADYAERRVAALAALDLAGYVTKSKSPSCGLADVPVHGSGDTAPGAFLAVLRRLLPTLPIIEETALEDPAARAAFLTAVLAPPRG
jgi:uncharacterized protein YbbK (DUF523 family)